MQKEFKYEYLIRKVIEDIIPGMSLGEIMPLSPELCRRYGVSEITVKKAMSLLSEQGIVKRIPKKGTILVKYPKSNTEISSGTVKKKLKILGRSDWKFVNCFKKILDHYCALHPDLGYTMTLEPLPEHRNAVLNSDFDLVLTNTWTMREFITHPRFQDRFLPMEQLKGFYLNESGIFEQVLKWCRDDRGVMNLPLTFSPIIAVYNREYPGISACLWKDGTGAMDFPEFRAHMAEIHRKSEFSCSPFLMPLSSNRWPILAKMLGGEIFSHDGKKCLLNTPEVVKSLDIFCEMLFKERVCVPFVPDNFEETFSNSLSVFASGRIACSWISYENMGKKYNFPTAYAKLPTMGQDASFLLIEGAMVGANTEYAESIAGLFNFIYRTENQISLATSCAGTTCVKNLANLVLGDLEHDFPGSRTIIEALDWSEPLVESPRMDIIDRMDKAMRSVWIGAHPPHEACEALTREFDQLIAEELEAVPI